MPTKPPDDPKNPRGSPRLTVVGGTVKGTGKTAAPGKPPRETIKLQTRVGQVTHPNKTAQAVVALGAAMGMTIAQIAKRGGISIDTIYEHYRDELENGADAVNLAIVANIVTIAKSATHPKAITAAIYWTKARMGWRDGDGAKTPDGGEGDEESATEFTLKIGDKRGSA
jgi:hypothetical protein